MRNAPQLIAYADRLAGDLPGLVDLLDGPLHGMFAGVHVLPFFHPIDGADAGFDPIDHTEVDERLGTWADVATLAARYHVAADLIANHVSAQSAAFLDWQLHGSASRYDGMFLTFGDVFPGGATEDQIAQLYRPRPGLCFTAMGIAGATRLIWTTFTGNQVDLNVEHPETRRYFESVLDRLAAAGVRLVRVDAVGYAVKKAGTPSFMIPATFDFIDRLRSACAERGMEMLVEIHGHHGLQITIAGHADWVYDFATPPLLLHALFTGDASPLEQWIRLRPRNSITVLDTHDGIGLTDVGPTRTNEPVSGLLTPEQVTHLVESIHRRTGGTSRLPTGVATDNRNLYQVNTTFYDAVGRADHDYMLCRLVQMFLPGIPQIYYAGLLAGTNDVDLFEATGVGRDVNRHRYSRYEIDRALERPVVQQLAGLLRWRASCRAFAGRHHFTAHAGSIELSWVDKASRAVLTVDFVTRQWTLVVDDGHGERFVDDLTQLPAI
jgi:sucrose phosphorylase